MAAEIISKTCTKCKIEKSVTEFQPNKKYLSGYQSWCKTCTMKAVRRYQKTDKGKIAAKRHKESAKAKATIRRWLKSATGQESMKRGYKKYHKNNPEKAKAGNAIRYKVQQGLIRPATAFSCCRCFNRAEEYHHHLGYAPEHRLDVVPLCKPCHRHIHSVKQLSFS